MEFEHVVYIIKVPILGKFWLVCLGQSVCFVLLKSYLF